MSAPLLNSAEQVKAGVEGNKQLVLFYFRGNEQKDNGGVKTLKKFMQPTKQSRVIAAQWNSNKPDDENYLEETFGINDKMGVVFFRNHKFLAMVPDIRSGEDQKFDEYTKILNGFDTWPVQLTPLERNAQVKHKATMTEKAESNCCVIL